MKRKFDFENENSMNNLNKKMKLEDCNLKKRKFEEESFESNKKQKINHFQSFIDKSSQTDIDYEKIQLYNENNLLKEMLNNLYNEYQQIKNDYEMRIRKQEYIHNVY
jgi:hypothetical protein